LRRGGKDWVVRRGGPNKNLGWKAIMKSSGPEFKTRLNQFFTIGKRGQIHKWEKTRREKGKLFAGSPGMWGIKEGAERKK